MSLANMIPISAMITEISRWCGNLVSISGAGNSIERAINDAYLQSILKYHHAEFEVRPPLFLDSETVVAVDGTVGAYSKTIVSSNPMLAPEANGGFGQRLVGGVFSFDDDSSGQTIQSITPNTNTPPWTITVAPEVQAARVSKPYKIYITRYPLPKEPPDTLIPLYANGKLPFYIYDVSDVSTRIPLKMQDVRVFDRSAIVVGNPVYYARVNNELIVYPAPFRTNGNTVLKCTFQIRYAKRPLYKSGSDTLDPMPEEWQTIVMQEAYALILDQQNEHDRANAIRESATRLATEIMKPYIEEVEDADAGFTPRLGYN